MVKFLMNSITENKMKKNIKLSSFLTLLFSSIFLCFSGCGGTVEKQGSGEAKEVDSSTTFAYVTNGVDPFWDLCAAGVRIAEKEFGIKCEILMPPKGVVDQKRMM